MSKLIELWEVSKNADHSDKDIKRLIDSKCNFHNISCIMDELDDLRAFKVLALELANRAGFDSVAGALNSIDYNQKITPAREIRKRYTTDYALALEMGITPAQLKRFLDRDAFFNIHTGEFFQVAKTKANIGLYEGNK